MYVGAGVRGSCMLQWGGGNQQGMSVLLDAVPLIPVGRRDWMDAWGRLLTCHLSCSPSALRGAREGRGRGVDRMCGVGGALTSG
ncbi:hypothetical protein GCM10009603_03570 [Nocardiopsis exhalans]